MRILTAGTVDCISEAELARKLGTGRPLRVKLGIDPTASDLHLGFAVVLRKLRQFQDLGHVAVLIIGDFTARVGDPSGRSATRPPLTPAEVDAHAQTYVDQVRALLDFSPDRIEIARNAEWLGRMDMADVLRMTARTTVARIMERDDFSKRFRDGLPIALSELLYPLLQGTDSVEVRADVELGGTDQLFNNLMGRQLQEAAGQEPQVVLTTPLLEGLDGVQKMSKSLGNYVGIAEPPAEQFGKLMSIPDALMPTYFQLTTGWLPDQVESTVGALAGRLTGAGRGQAPAGPHRRGPVPRCRAPARRPRPSSTGSSSRARRRRRCRSSIVAAERAADEAVAPARRWPGSCRRTRRAGARSSRVACAWRGSGSPIPTSRSAPPTSTVRTSRSASAPGPRSASSSAPLARPASSG